MIFELENDTSVLVDTVVAGPSLWVALVHMDVVDAFFVSESGAVDENSGIISNCFVEDGGQDIDDVISFSGNIMWQEPAGMSLEDVRPNIIKCQTIRALLVGASEIVKAVAQRSQLLGEGMLKLGYRPECQS